MEVKIKQTGIFIIAFVSSCVIACGAVDQSKALENHTSDKIAIGDDYLSFKNYESNSESGLVIEESIPSYTDGITGIDSKTSEEIVYSNFSEMDSDRDMIKWLKCTPDDGFILESVIKNGDNYYAKYNRGKLSLSIEVRSLNGMKGEITIYVPSSFRKSGVWKDGENSWAYGVYEGEQNTNLIMMSSSDNVLLIVECYNCNDDYYQEICF